MGVKKCRRKNISAPDGSLATCSVVAVDTLIVARNPCAQYLWVQMHDRQGVNLKYIAIKKRSFCLREVWVSGCSDDSRSEFRHRGEPPTVALTPIHQKLSSAIESCYLQSQKGSRPRL
jgi:hypothetical protein